MSDQLTADLPLERQVEHWRGRCQRKERAAEEARKERDEALAKYVEAMHSLSALQAAVARLRDQNSELATQLTLTLAKLENGQ